MPKAYTVLTIGAPEDLSDILKAELSLLGFNIFLDLENGAFETAIESDSFDCAATEEIISRYGGGSAGIQMVVRHEAQQNWNTLWETHYPPVIVNDYCIVRAAFHEPMTNRLGKPYLYDLVITPQMSFGTGHHETTSQMLALILDLDCQGKRVADFGCGTGILAILALKKGAALADGCDIEDWSVESAAENAQLNGVLMRTYVGTAAECGRAPGFYDLIFANINLAVLLAELPTYAQLLAPKGKLLLSGFYVSDIAVLQEACRQQGLTMERQSEKNNWAALQFKKQ
ncbi:MAG: 50S ribosomal protein L11 methyltransferase [Cytophagales bacterium]|nr:50S ribosomal protein L11 methyltransferase [Bernardetiaceae bacterium]MDW8203983.1 50S ribosomal protein L11 methyltransferase [Cytophagales bacterium]